MAGEAPAPRSPAERIFVFAPGAGAPSRSPWMQRWAQRLQALGAVFPFDYPYMKAGKKRPDRQPVLVAAHREALAAARRQAPPGARAVLVGKSMGSRMGCHLSLEEPVDALICFGYPLRSGTSGALRDEVLRQLRTPVLFVQGSRDPLCPLDLLAATRRTMTAPSELFVVEGGDHSLLLTQKALRLAGTTQERLEDTIAEAVRAFLDRVLG